MRRDVFDEDQLAFRDTVRTLIEREMAPHFEEWEERGRVPRSFYRRLGSLGILGMAVPEEYGGSGVTTYKYSAILTEETCRSGFGLGTLRVHMDIALPYLLRYGTEAQKKDWVPRAVTGETLLAIAMTEPGTGSDLAGVTTSARQEGDGFVLNGGKTFITGALNAGLFLVVARTSPGSEENRRSGLSLFLVESDNPGLTVGSNLRKLGLKSQDTAELSLVDAHVPTTALLGEEGRAFEYLESNLPQERLSIAVGSVASAEYAVELTARYVRERQVFGRRLSSLQNTKFVLAGCATEVEAARSFVDRALDAHETGELTAVDAAKLKLFCSEAQGRIVDQCLQLFGGYGYMLEYPISRLYADARVTRIYGGTSEIMKTIIARSMKL